MAHQSSAGQEVKEENFGLTERQSVGGGHRERMGCRGWKTPPIFNGSESDSKNKTRTTPKLMHYEASKESRVFLMNTANRERVL